MCIRGWPGNQRCKNLICSRFCAGVAFWTGMSGLNRCRQRRTSHSSDAKGGLSDQLPQKQARAESKSGLTKAWALMPETLPSPSRIPGASQFRFPSLDGGHTKDQNVVLHIDANASLNDEAGILCGGRGDQKECGWPCPEGARRRARSVHSADLRRVWADVAQSEAGFYRGPSGLACGGQRYQSGTARVARDQ